MKIRIGIIGSGDLGQQIAHYISQSNTHKVTGYFDDFAEVGSDKKEAPVIGKIADLMDGTATGFDQLLIGIGYKHLPFRERIFDQLTSTYEFATFVDDSCLIDPNAEVEMGTVVFPGVHLDTRAVVRRNSIININTTISHDSVVGANSFLSPRVAIAGYTNVGERNILGINSTLIDNLTTHPDVQLGAGAVLVTSAEQPGLYVGVPATFKKANIHNE